MAISVNVPVATNQVSADLTAMAANMKYVVSGDGTAGRVLRLSKLTIADGTAASTIKVKMDSVWNGNDIAEENNLGIGTNFYIMAVTTPGISWFRIYINGVAISGDFVAILNTTIFQNASGDDFDVSGKLAGSGGMYLTFQDPTTGEYVGLNTIMSGSNEVIIYITYLTSA